MTRTRFAPSPTGTLHIGGARTALYCWLQARRNDGEFILRVEDTDRERSTDEAVRAIIESMAWLGLDADEGPYYQTLRMDRYRQVAEELLRAGKAYYAYESREEIEAMRAQAMARGEKPRYSGAYRDRNAERRDDPNRVLRFKNPQAGTVVFEDKVKGRISWDNSELDDFVIIRPDDTPTYNFAVVIDDVDMRISEVIRGDDHINNTPRQINVYQAMGAEVPEFAHLPMILGSDGQKLSKRHGAVGVMEYRDEGYLPHALLNYLVRLGWSHGDQEIFSLQEMITLFDVADANTSAARFDTEKLRWLNQHYLKTDDPDELAPQLEWQLRAQGLDVDAGPAAADVIVALRERVHTLKEMAETARIWYGPLAGYDEQAVSKHLHAPLAEAALRAAHEQLGALADWTVADINGAIKAAAASLDVGMGKVAPTLRVAMTGTQVSPSIDHTVYLAGRDEALRRIDAAVAKAQAGAGAAQE